MNDLNSLIIEGTVVQQLNVTKAVTGQTVGRMEISVARTYKNYAGEEITETGEYPVECFGQLAEFVRTKINEKDKVRVVGRLKMNEWMDTDGKKYKSFVILAENVEHRKA